MARTPRNTVGAVAGGVAGLTLVCAFVAAYNLTATTPEDLLGRGGLILSLVLGGLGGAALGGVLADVDGDDPD